VSSFTALAKGNIMPKYNKKLRSTRRKRQQRLPRTADDFFAQADTDQDAWNRVLRTIAKMRTEGLSLKKAAKEAGVTPRKVISWGGRAIKKGKNGRYAVAKRDSLLRVVQVPTSAGNRELELRNSKHATLLGQYWDAVQKYLRTGDSSAVEKFKGKKIKDVNGQEVDLITDLKELNRLGSAGVLSFESLYARAA
jgi:hypothetical protein